VNWVDIIFGLILILFLIAGIRRGFIREAVGLVSLLLAFILGTTMAPIWSRIVVERFHFPPSVATVVVFILIFILVFILVRAVGNLLFKIVRATPLDLIDRLGGGLVGLVKGGLVISLILVFLGLFSLPLAIDQSLNDSTLTVPMKALAPAVYGLVQGAVPQMRSLGEVVGESVESGLSRGQEEIREKSSQVIDKLEESKSEHEGQEKSETQPETEKK